MPRPKKKRQTRLTFSPLTSSSSAASSYPNQIKERAAAVRYDNHDRSAKKRRINGHSPTEPNLDFTSSPSFIYSNPKVVVESPPKAVLSTKKPSIFTRTALPTPEASSQIEENMKKRGSVIEKSSITLVSSSEEDVHITPVPKRLFSDRTKAKNSGSDIFADSSSPLTKAKLRAISGPSPVALAGSQIKFGTDGDVDSEASIDEHDRVVISSSEDESDQLKKRANFFSSTRNRSDTQTPPRTGPEPTSYGRPRRVISSRSRESSIPEILLERNQSTESPTKTFSSGPNSTSIGRYKRVGSERLALNMSKISEPPAPKRHNNQGANMDIPDNHESITSDSDEILTPARRRPTATPTKGKVRDDSSDDVRGPALSSRKRVNRARSNVIPISDGTDSSSEGVLKTPGRKGRLRRDAELPKLFTSAAGNESTNDLQEDLEDLKETEVRSTRTRGSQRTPKKSKAQEQLELIKRRRAGEKVDGSGRGQNRTPSGRQRALYDTTDDDEESNVLEVLSEEEEVYHQPIRAGEDLDQYDEDFVIEDEDSTIGAPADLTDMPFEFTRYAHKKPIEHFKDAVEWMVHNKLNPAFPRDDANYQVAFRKLDDEVQGLAGSKFISAAWGGDFLRALKSRPEVTYLENTDSLNLRHCAACNKSNHPAKFQLTFSGRPYDRHTLEDLSDDSDSDSRHQNDHEPDSQEIFHVGRTCCANAETGHALHHWRHALNHWVLKWLHDQRYTTPTKIVQRESWSTKRKSEFANSIVDGMVDSGEMRQLYKEFKENLQAARDARNDRIGYGRRSGR